MHQYTLQLGRSQALYTAPRNGGVNHGAHIEGFGWAFAEHTRKNKCKTNAHRAAFHCVFIFPLRLQQIQVTYGPDEPRLFWFQRKTRIEPLDRFKMAQVLGSILYISVTTCNWHVCQFEISDMYIKYTLRNKLETIKVWILISLIKMFKKNFKVTLWTLAAGFQAAGWKCKYPGGWFLGLWCVFCLQTEQCAHDPANYSNLTFHLIIYPRDIQPIRGLVS